MARPLVFVGADGCKTGWFTVLLSENTDWKVKVFPDVSRLWKEFSNALIILIDIPIGLRDEGPQGRLCDIEARKLLKPKRQFSVFKAPCRSAIDADNYRKAYDKNKRMTGKGFSLQTWNIIPKIREVDDFLSNNESARSRIREIHPEICFWAFAGHPMKNSKKKREGFSERMRVLQSVYPHTNDIVNHALFTYKRKEVARDDILDALSAAVTAAMGIERLVSIPETPECDSKGLPMEMVYCSHSR